jgi:thermitase
LLAATLIVSPALASNDPYFKDQWGMQKIKAEEAWSISGGSGVTIAVIDTGATLTHEDLGPKLVEGKDFVDGGTPDDVTGGPADGCSGNPGHGTHVAGIAAAATNNSRGVAGVAPSARIMPVRVLDQRGCGSLEDVTDGIRWAADHGAHVINLSLGEDEVFRYLLGSALEEAVEYAWNRGVVSAIAAGNSTLPSGYFDIHALIVGATTQSDGQATFSNFGEAQWSISAPGSSIFSTLPGGYNYLSGTSMAAPHVAGAAAVLRCLGLNKQQTVDRILNTSDDLGFPGKDPQFGHGRLNLSKAAQGLTSSGCGVSGGSGSSGGGTSGGGSTSSGGSTRRSSGSRAASSPAAGPAQPAAPESSPSPSPTESARAGALGAESAREEGGGNLLLNIALLFLFLASGVALYVWNYWRTSRSLK